jgi:uncharacterized protein (TIGR03382 family)
MHPCEPGGADGAPACSSSPSFEQTTMYPLYRGPAGRELSPDDVAGACFLYPAHACATAGCSGGLVCSADGCVEGCGGRVCAADESCNAGECVRDVPTAECAADADCASSDRCALGRCVSSGAGFGDPCDSADACASTLCTEGGYCGASCATDADCPARSACDAGACIPEAGVFGDACEMADDCVTGLCLDDGEARATCTRTCASLEQCPVGLTCGDVDGERVCRPPESSGCAASGDGPASGVLSVLVLLFFWRRR